jgi:hypothetical protein
MDPLLREAAAISELGLSFPARLRLLSESLLWQIVHRLDHVWVFLHEYRQLQGEYRTLFREKRQRFEGTIRDALEEGSRLGRLRVTDLDLATLAFLNLHNYTYQWVAGRDLSVEDLARFYCEIFLNGVLTTPADPAATDGELARGRAVLEEMRDPALTGAGA